MIEVRTQGWSFCSPTVNRGTAMVCEAVKSLSRAHTPPATQHTNYHTHIPSLHTCVDTTLCCCSCTQIVGRTSSWIDPDAADADAASSSCAALQQQLSWAAFLGLQAVLLPQPKQLHKPFNYAQVINQVGCCSRASQAQHTSHHQHTMTAATAGPRVFSASPYHRSCVVSSLIARAALNFQSSLLSCCFSIVMQWEDPCP
jgi:hypothetical protein